MTDGADARDGWKPSLLLDLYAHALVGLRWVIVAFWVVVAALAVTYLPPLGHGGEDLEQLVTADNPAVQSELRSFEKFGFPLLSRVAVVQRNENGLPPDIHAKALTRARDVTEGNLPDVHPILAAVPVSNQIALPGSKETGTTIITMLFTAPDVNLANQAEAAKEFVAKHYGPEDGVVGVTGSVPARVEQGRIVLSSLTWLDVVTVAAVFLIVAIAFRSLIAPLVALGVAGLAILLTIYVGGALAQRYDIAVPQETQPLVIALLLGVVTDYVVFYLSAVRTRLAEGMDRLAAARWATARYSPIIIMAGVIAAAGTGALIVADSPAFRAFGPGMAVAVLIGMAVAVTLVPALLAILGPAVLWSPRRRARLDVSDHRPPSRWWAKVLTWPGFSFLVVVACLGGLLWAALPVAHMKLGVSFIEALPPGHSARQAATQAELGFAAGILSPTELLVQGPGVSTRAAELANLQQSLGQVPGVAAVIGPEHDNTAIPQLHQLFYAPDGTAARYLLIFSDEPLGADAVSTLARLQRELPGFLETAGLTGVEATFGGDTALAKVAVDQTTNDLGRIAVAALLANLILLALFMRALIAPMVLLACSVLAVFATLGLTTRLFQDTLGNDSLTFYVPFAAAVLLVALGSDYNIFGVGPAWKEARSRPLREALAATLPQSARAIRTAAITLAVSFGLLALVPLRPFRELAFALSVGILIDAFVVRSLLAPALLSIIGSGSQWPNRGMFRRRARPVKEPEPDVAQESA